MIEKKQDDKKFMVIKTRNSNTKHNRIIIQLTWTCLGQVF